MKTILVLTDFSPRAGNAAEYAMHIALKNKANLVLCNAIELTSQLSNGVEYNWPIADHLLLKNESLLHLKNLGERLENLAPKDSRTFMPSISFISHFGPLSAVAEKVITENNVDMLVIGSHKSNSLARLIFGSHTHTLLDTINCPVLLVPDSLEFKGVSTLSYATDFTFSDFKVINYLATIAKPFNAKILVNHISAPDNQDVDSNKPLQYSVNDFLAKNHPKIYYTNFKGKNIAASLLKINGSENVDLLALVHRRHGFFEGLFRTSLSKKIASKAKIPLLILPYSFSVDVADISKEQLDHFCFETSDTR